MTELDQIARRYARRDAGDRYSLLRPEVWQMWQERQRELLKLLAKRPGRPADWRATEVGCGAGGNLLDLLRLGAEAPLLSGIELLPERCAAARAVLPSALRLIEGDALLAEVQAQSQDAVLAFTVFSSLLDDAVQQRLAEAMWRWVRPGGGVLWYDFCVDNPRNADVRGVPLARVRALFPKARCELRRVTLAPPIARAALRLHAGLPALVNVLAPLRTHRLCWLVKTN